MSVLDQPNRNKWREQPPKVMRGDMRAAFTDAAEADKLECQCWNANCPYHGDCKKCIVFHSSLKQLPTCQRDMVIEMYNDGYLLQELYIENGPETPPQA